MSDTIDTGQMEAAPQPQAGGCGCGGASAVGPDSGSGQFIYALGRIEARFPSVGVEKELIQATGRADVAGLTDRQALQSVLSQKQNRYLARQMCWVFTVEGLETYILVPRDPSDYDLLVEAVRPSPRATDVDVVIGIQGPIASADVCNGLLVPIVTFDQIYSFDVDSLIKNIPRPDSIPEDRFGAASEEIFSRVMQLADNAGATDEHRALNYLAVRYPAIYATAADAFGRNQALTSVDVQASPLSAARNVVDVILTFTHRETGVDERSFARVDVTEEFPFLVTRISPYYSR